MLFKWFENRVNPYPDPLVTPPSSFWAFLWSCTEGLRGMIAIAVFFSVIGGAFEAILFAMLGSVIDWLAAVPPSQLWEKEKFSLLLLAAIVLASPLIATLHSLIKFQTLAGNFPMLLRWKFHRHMLNQSYSFYQNEFAGRVSAKVMQTALATRETVMTITDILVYITIYFVTMSAVIGSFDPWLLLPFLGWLSCYAMMLAFFVPRLGKAASRQADARALMTGRITDAYANIATVKLFSHAHREADYARFAMQSFMKTVHAQMRLVTGLVSINTFLSMLLLTCTSGVALWLWTQEKTTIGAVAAVTAMALRLNGLSQWIMWEMTMLFEAVGTVQDGIRTLSLPPEVVDRQDAKPLVVTRGELSFENVSFGYGNGKTVIDDFTLRIRSGEKIGLVGRSGAGKSTIVNLLLRFYDVKGGRIVIDGQNIADVTQASLRMQIGMVTQDTSLLHRSVRDNLAYGRPDATEEEIIAAACKAEAYGFISELDDGQGRTGLDAHVGERGVKLSGGQRQRIAIARVMLKDAPILLLDEATSALDSEIEIVIQSSLYRLMEGKTVIAIAHRLSTIAAMDRLIVLDQGKIAEEGDHKTLLARNGLYARLWAHQSGGFLGE
ncbi:MAG: ABC transporter ATP-binding protein/permease [Burkholderiales bacterium]|jgi:ATP-binding cassette subfamily B multidrug efflux pump|nr:ABC transporter ATP-binding protein/permease [Burkholderiales bacterium]